MHPLVGEYFSGVVFLLVMEVVLAVNHFRVYLRIAMFAMTVAQPRRWQEEHHTPSPLR